MDIVDGLWVVTDNEGKRWEHDGWSAAAQQYRGLVLEWARVQDKFTAVVSGEPGEWMDALDADDVFGDLVVGRPHYLELMTNDGVGGEAVFRLDPGPGAS